MSLARRYAARGVGACSLPTGGTCRENPIPPGVYWIDSIDPYSGVQDTTNADEIEAARDTYLIGIEANYAQCYRIIRTVHHDAQLVGDIQPARDWILFEVSCPIPRWSPETKWGLPTVAPRGLDTQEGDTVQMPPPEKGPLDEVFGGDGIPGWALVAAGAAGVLALVYALK